MFESRQHKSAPEKAFSISIIMRLRPRCIREICAKDTTARVADYDDESATFPSICFTPTVERAERGAVLIDTVQEMPLVLELKTRWNQQSNLFGDGFP